MDRFGRFCWESSLTLWKSQWIHPSTLKPSETMESTVVGPSMKVCKTRSYFPTEDQGAYRNCNSWTLVTGPIFVSTVQKPQHVLWQGGRNYTQYVWRKLKVWDNVTIAAYLAHPIPKTSADYYEYLCFKDGMKVINCLYQEILQRLHSVSYIWLKYGIFCLLDYFLQFRFILHPRLCNRKRRVRNWFPKLNDNTKVYTKRKKRKVMGSPCKHIPQLNLPRKTHVLCMKGPKPPCLRYLNKKTKHVGYTNNPCPWIRRTSTYPYEDLCTIDHFYYYY